MPYFSSKPTKVVLWGELGDRVVPEMDMEITTVKEAIQCLQVNYPGFDSTVLDLQSKGYAYSIVLMDGDREYQLDGSHPERYPDFQVSGKTLVISPVLAGRNIGKLFLGVAMIGIGLITGGTGFILAGIAMGLQSIFSGNPESPEKEGDPKESLVVTGQTNTTAEGNRIPIIIGKFRVGDQILSATYKTEFRAG
jgi:predicted phage tail protein